MRRYIRQPAALQRVTGRFTPHVALRPLDSLLAIRVLDNRGAELDSVAVAWTLADAGDNASLRVIDAITDSAGVSRAEFTPGRSANVQRVIAEVGGVGRIEFPITIPARTIRNTPADIVLWAGEDSTVVAALSDASHNALAGGNVTWATSDPTTVNIEGGSGTTGRLRAVAAGIAHVFSFPEPGADSREPGTEGREPRADGREPRAPVRGTTRVTVRPVVHGRLITLDGGAPPNARVVLEGEGVRDTLEVRGGAFGARVHLDPDADLRVHVIPSGSTYHRASVRVGRPRELQSLSIALIPARFAIDAGLHRGESIAIDAAAAMRRGSSAPFWRVAPLSGDTPRKLLGWRDAEYPLRIAFNRSASNSRIDAADSAAFWQIANSLEEDLGRDLFVPAQLADSARGSIVRVEIRPQSSEGHTFVSWEQAGDAHEGVVLFRDAGTLRDAHVVTHELVHLIGFGHATAWTSVSQAVNGSAKRLTVEDVAYIQLAMRLRSLQERTGARPGLPALGPRP